MAETFHLKLNNTLNKQIELLIREFGFANKTEFIRQAIRDFIRKREQDRFISELRKFRGIWKGGSPDAWKLTKKEKDEILKEFLEEKGFKDTLDWLKKR